MKSDESMGSEAMSYAAVGARMLEIATAHGIETGIKAAMDYLAEERKKAKPIKIVWLAKIEYHT